jgi:hypothetical protein
MDHPHPLLSFTEERERDENENESGGDNKKLLRKKLNCELQVVFSLLSLSFVKFDSGSGFPAGNLLRMSSLISLLSHSNTYIL